MLNADDYTHLFKWYELVFAAGDRQPTSAERNTFIKISAMAMGYSDDQRAMRDDKDDKSEHH